MILITSKARVYCNFGRWIADCPLGCGNAMSIDPKDTSPFFCRPPGGCGHICEVEWPDNAQEIWDALCERPAPKNRNWFPEGHDLAVRSGCPHGQTPEDLRKETKENMEEGA